MSERHAQADALDAAVRAGDDARLPALRALLDELALEHRGLRLRYVPAGRVRLGDDLGEPDERPARDVELAGFYLGETVVCHGDLEDPRVLEDSGIADFGRLNQGARGGALGERCPVVGVTHSACTAWARSVGLRLPRDDEWERAARGLTAHDDEPPWGSRAEGADWLGTDAAPARLRPPRAFAPNGYGLYGMFGGVWEWCEEVYRADRHAPSRDDGRRSLRGGSLIDDREVLRPSFRMAAHGSRWSSVVGVRFAMDLDS